MLLAPVSPNVDRYSSSAFDIQHTPQAPLTPKSRRDSIDLARARSGSTRDQENQPVKAPTPIKPSPAAKASPAAKTPQSRPRFTGAPQRVLTPKSTSHGAAAARTVGGSTPSAPRSGAFGGPPRRVPVDARLAAAASASLARAAGLSRAERISLGGNATADDADVDAGASYEPEVEVPGLRSAPRRAAPGDEDAAEAHFAPPAPAAGDGGSVVRLEPMRAKRGDVDALGAAEVLTPVRRSARSVTGPAAPALDLLGVTNFAYAGNTTLFPEAATAEEARAGGFARPLATSRVMVAEKVAATGGAGVEDVKGIGPKRAAALQAAGVRTAAELAALTDERMAAMARAGLPLKVLKASVDAARELLAAEQ